MTARRSRLALFAILCLLPLGAAVADERPMKALTLDNGLEVLLISDMEADRAGASLTVGVGSMADGEHPGIAHFLEHMLFLGTAKYPDPAAYADYLAENDGSSNAYTAEDHTNYFFQVKAAAFEGALDRFAQFFIAPLMSDTLSEREVNAVDSEHSRNLENDFWRRRQVWRELLNPEHPRQGFSTGSRATLSGVRNETLRAFHEREYSADRMALCVVAPYPLASLESWAREKFSAVVDRKRPRQVVSAPLFTDLAGSRVDVKSIRDIRELMIHFELDAASFDPAAKPTLILGGILGHEGRESLLQSLKEEGWATGLNAGAQQVGEAGTLDLDIQLTEAGLANVEGVTERVFGMINLLREGGELSEHLIEEAQSMQEIQLRFRQPGQPYDEVRSLGAAMMVHPHENLLESLYLIRAPSRESLAHVLDQLRPERACLVVNAKSVETDRVEKHYGAEYAVRPFSEAFKARLSAAKAVGAMGLPAPNPFLPSDFDLLALRHVEEPFVHRFRGGELWLRQDEQFGQPKAALRAELMNGLNQASARDFVLGNLFAAAATEALTPEAYPALLAGLSGSITSERGGLSIEASGFSDRLPEFVEFAAPFLTELRIDEPTFEILREKQLRELRNKVRQAASAHAFDLFRELVREVNWSDEEQLAALESVDFAALGDYVARSRRENYLRGFVYGNLDQKELRRLARALRSELGGTRVLPEASRFAGRILKMSPGTSAVLRKEVQSNDSACLLVYQGEPLSDTGRAMLRITSQIASNRFYQDLRTLQQTGYIVGASGIDVEGLPIFYFLSQSSVVDTAELRGRFESFIRHFVDDFGELGEEELERNREAAIAQVLKKRTSFAEELAWNFDAAFALDGDFEAEQREAAALRELDFETLRAAVPAFFAEEGVRRVSIEILGDPTRRRFQPASLEELREGAEGFWKRPKATADSARTTAGGGSS